MGNCFSDPSKPTSGGQKLGSGPASSSQPPISPRRTAPPAVPPRTLGGTGGGSGGVTALGAEIGEGDGDARDRALRAAEERAKAVSRASRFLLVRRNVHCGGASSPFMEDVL